MVGAFGWLLVRWAGVERELADYKSSFHSRLKRGVQELIGTFDADLERLRQRVAKAQERMRALADELEQLRLQFSPKADDCRRLEDEIQNLDDEVVALGNRIEFAERERSLLDEILKGLSEGMFDLNRRAVAEHDMYDGLRAKARDRTVDRVIERFHAETVDRVTASLRKMAEVRQRLELAELRAQNVLRASRHLDEDAVDPAKRRPGGAP